MNDGLALSQEAMILLKQLLPPGFCLENCSLEIFGGGGATITFPSTRKGYEATKMFVTGTGESFGFFRLPGETNWWKSYVIGNRDDLKEVQETLLEMLNVGDTCVEK